MSKYRQDRINDRVASEISQIVRDIKDPRVSGSLITINAADVSPDLKYAKVYYSAITGEDPELKRGLTSAAGFVRCRLAKELNLRITPEITFIYDDSAEHGVKIASILNGLNITKEDAPDDGESLADESDK